MEISSKAMKEGIDAVGAGLVERVARCGCSDSKTFGDGEGFCKQCELLVRIMKGTADVAVSLVEAGVIEGRASSQDEAGARGKWS